MNHDEYTKSMEDQLEDKDREIDDLKYDLRAAEDRAEELEACLERMSTDIGEVL